MQFFLLKLKLRHYENATKFRKSHISFDKTSVLIKHLFLLSSVKTSGRFFQIFVTFSEELDFIMASELIIHLL